MQYAEEFEGLMLAVKLLTLLISMMALSHVGCCLWYGVGNIDDCGQWSLHRSILVFICLQSDCDTVARLGAEELSGPRRGKSNAATQQIQ
jgi:hypothetical protein